VPKIIIYIAKKEGEEQVFYNKQQENLTLDIIYELT